MESGDSRPGSTASIRSWDNSHQSSPSPSNNNDEPVEQDASRHNNNLSPAFYNNPHSNSESASSSLSISSYNEVDECKSLHDDDDEDKNDNVDFQKNEGFSQLKGSISHDDLSDVSEIEIEKKNQQSNEKSSIADDDDEISLNGTNDENNSKLCSDQFLCTNSKNIDLRQKLDQRKTQMKTNENDKLQSLQRNASNSEKMVCESIDILQKSHDEDALDFEAEEGECQEISQEGEGNNNIGGTKDSIEEMGCTEQADKTEELEEGEVSDEDEKRPEETEPKPICRFYTRGQCTWGMSCRFLHPGVTDKGNYTMFDLVPPISMQSGNSTNNRNSSYALHTTDFRDYRNERPAMHHRSILQPQPPSIYVHQDHRAIVNDGPVVIESAWERGLRTAKEMVRKASKLKEQDIDFDDKKMNLTLSPDELEKDSYHLRERTSPPNVLQGYSRHGGFPDIPPNLHSPTERYPRSQNVPGYDEIDPYRSARYRELPPHRMPQYEDDRRQRPTREVILQRVEPTNSRADEWNDPWMRSKSPIMRGSDSRDKEKRKGGRRSYSSNSSYSSTSSSQSVDSSSDSSGTSSKQNYKRRYNAPSKKSAYARRYAIRSVRSPSPTIKRSRRSPSSINNSPSLKRRIQPSPMAKRNNFDSLNKHRIKSPTLKKNTNRLKRRRTTSSSESSESSASDSDSESGSSSTDSSAHSRGAFQHKRLSRADEVLNERKAVRKDAPKKRSPISIELRKQTTVGTSALVSPSHHPIIEKDVKKSRREELLKQLKAVEDAIAKKRSKLN